MMVTIASLWNRSRHFFDLTRCFRRGSRAAVSRHREHGIGGFLSATAGLLAAVTLLCLGACLSILEGEAVSSDAASLPVAERAVLLGQSRWYLAWGWDISIYAVDDSLETGFGLRKAEVVPGHHTITVEHFVFLGGGGSTGRCSFELNLQPGHQYQLLSVDNRDRFWAVQTHSNFTIDVEDILPGEKRGLVQRLPCEVYPPAEPANPD